MNLLLTGGAGYVGSHVLRALLAAGHRAVVFDDLSNGHAAAVHGAELVRGDILDASALDALLGRYRFDAVMHFCGLIEAGESVSQPERYRRVNVDGGMILLDAMVRAGVRRIIFSSTAAVYGNPEKLPIPESHPTRPVNPYGETKLAFERALEDRRRQAGLGFVSLRYFNAAGADASGDIGEAHRNESHLIPRLLKAARDGSAFAIFGDDYDTRDGTAERDFVHITDLADAHVLALKALDPDTSHVWNVGTGRGHTCREVVAVARRVAGRDIRVVTGPRRPGDPPVLVACSDAIRRDLGWMPRYAGLDEIIQSAWKWHSSHPNGFGDE